MKHLITAYTASAKLLHLHLKTYYLVRATLVKEKTLDILSRERYTEAALHFQDFMAHICWLQEPTIWDGTQRRAVM